MKPVLVIKPSSLGDIIHSLPVVTALKSAGHPVHFAARREYLQLLEICPAVDRILEFPGCPCGIPKFWRDMRSTEYDAVIDLQGLLRSGLASFFAQTHRRIGLPDARECSGMFYSETTSYRAGVKHAIERYLSVLDHLKIPGPAAGQSHIRIPDTAMEEARRLTAAPGYVVFSPLSRQSRKCWPSKSWEKLGEMFHEKNIPVVRVGHSGRTGNHATVSIWNDLVDQTHLPVLTAVLSQARLCVTVDSAPMHLAALLNIPVVALFGPTDPEKVGPYTDRRRIIRSQTGRMADINADEVSREIFSMMGER